jgi:catechol 2,3-dioxygenase-like lactoylglutathione lyase family enzyme
MGLTREETTYYVRDLDAAIAYYTERLGFSLKFKQEWGFALMEVQQNNHIGLMSVAAYAGTFPAYEHDTRPRAVLRADDIAAEHSRLYDNGVLVSPIAGETNGPRAFLFWDMEGSPFFVYSLS